VALLQDTAALDAHSSHGFDEQGDRVATLSEGVRETAGELGPLLEAGCVTGFEQRTAAPGNLMS
jgi:hypothetical protein